MSTAEGSYLTKKAVAARLNIHRETVSRLVREGRLPAPIKFTARGTCRWPPHVIDPWEAEQLAANADQGSPNHGEGDSPSNEVSPRHEQRA